jgi:hypothetical protein
MLISGSIATPLPLQLGASQGYSVGVAPATGVAFNHTFAPATGDLLAVMWLASRGTTTGVSVGLQWGASGPAFQQQAFIGAQGVANRAFVWIGTLHGADVGTAVAPVYTTSTGGAFGDLLLWTYDLAGWGGGVGVTAGTQQNTAGTSVSVAFTPRSGCSLLVGAAGAYDNTCVPYTVAGGPIKDFDGTSGGGGAGVASSGCSFTQQIAAPTAQTVTVSSATSDAAWAIGVVELF